MNDNIIITILEKEEQKRKVITEQRKEWGITQRNKLVKVLEEAGATITDHMWDLLLFNINGLRINSEGKVCYISFYKESKKIMELLRRYNGVVVENFKYITAI
jgi:hypothetical protein